MIIGVGTDITEIERMEQALRSEGFLRRVFTEEERRQSKGRAPFLAGCFAVKEAVVKCFGTGFSGLEPAEIEVLRDERGKPVVQLYGAAAACFSEKKGSRIEVSISNTKELAVAFAVLEGEEGEVRCDRA
ncbi:holo-[acyl-carrier protein] synthase [Fusobacterium naviforme]|uniref:Holo-[acyl-carrier-protein] synthase n=1 Tax=Moryella indoligenes TaxID=371674 RepID=A0AAE3VAS3_9FIRM|nr:holo-ACP synthase [Moryella indoligenes]KAB0576568.1 holo-[acyl-carrier-protein] synthase [Fusobacterium naviforme]MDQ0152896.1 holo-[acyl-carrier protein] synthase [Moryella indoligenes]PSL09599.1 holo-[acyl-carrier protein] synthase [Fusobacterium naviforme]STO27409.1 Holo-[acyl-carrier-protein] synthase [Fusobacterium naviforme]